MDDDKPGLDLAATLPAGELAKLRRRVAYLEAAMMQVLREDWQVREWFTAGELAGLALPGLPTTASGLARLARREGWEVRITTGKGGERTIYHVASLPRRAFAAFLDRVLIGTVGTEDVAAERALVAPRASPPPVPTSAAVTGKGGSATPQWVLPLLRLMRGGLALEDALERLPSVPCVGRHRPAVGEARDVLRALGMLSA